MGCVLKLPCCVDDSAYDFKCEGCKKKLPREQELFLLATEDEDKIFCSSNCRADFNDSSCELSRTPPRQ